MFLAVNLRFGKKLRRSRERVEETDACLPVYESGETDTPCLFGVAKPSIYVTPDTRTEAETLRYALAHEQTHYRHGDNLLGGAARRVSGAALVQPARVVGGGAFPPRRGAGL